jgi:hypothetical protein
METNKHAWPTMQQGRGERRRDVRITAPAELGCIISGFAGDIRARNISAGGLAVYVPTPVKTRVEHDVTLTFGEMTIVCRVRVAYCYGLDRGRWLAGLTVLGSSVGPTLDTLIDAIQKESNKLS